MNEAAVNTARFVSKPRVTWREALEGSLTLTTAAVVAVGVVVGWRLLRRRG